MELSRTGWIRSESFDKYFSNESIVRYHGGADETTIVAQSKDGNPYVIKHKDTSVWGDRARDQYRRVSPAFVERLGVSLQPKEFDDSYEAIMRRLNSSNYFTNA